MKYTFVGDIKPDDITVEDSGTVKYVAVTDSNDSVLVNGNLFMMIHSTDDFCNLDETPNHEEFDKLIGKRVRVTLEVIN